MALSSAASPSDIVRQLFEAIDDGRWTEAAYCIDPADIHAQYDRAQQALRGDAYLCVVDVLDVGMAHAETARINERAGSTELTLQRPGPSGTAVVADTRDIEELESIGPEGLMGRLIARAIGQLRQPLARKSEEAPSHASPAGPTSPSHIRRVVIGDALETDVLAHVVYRGLLQREERTYLLDPVRVVTVHRTPAGWRVPGPAYDHIRPKGPILRLGRTSPRHGRDRFEPAWL